MEDSDIEDSDMEDSEMEDSDIEDSDMEESDMADANMEFSGMEDSDTEDSDIEDGDIGGSDMNVFLLVGCLTSQQHVSVSQGRICSDNFTCCHTEIEVAEQTFHLTQSQYTDTGPTSPSTDPITPGAWQGSHWSANFSVTGMTPPRKNLGASSRGGRLYH